ncbi:MAG: DUF559 domain-containing protein, partial [Caldilineaceae bacterium]|nr:DUF559 domain-containing protein [Caldilineaceae bacterium]
MVEQQANLVARLALHQSQRNQSIPTLSDLQGQAIAARQVWAQWVGTTNRHTAVCVYSEPLALFEAWLTAVIQQHDLQALVIQRVDQLAGQPADHLTAWLGHADGYQSELFWQQIAPVSEEAAVLRALLEALISAKTAARRAVDAMSRLFNHTGAPTVRKSFATVAQLLPPPSMPGLFILSPPETDQSTLHATLAALTQLVEATPVLPIGLALTTEQANWALGEFPESRTKAMVRNGLIMIPAPAQSELRQWLHTHGVEDADRQQTILDLAQKHGATTEVLATAVILTDPARQHQGAEAATIYRSQAEAFLYRYLEINPSTVGRFQVNAQLDIDFGGRPMEVDFLDAAAKIVIELDGHYHFGSFDHYRRDRRKDRLLQQHGFLVLRFLSEDVVSQL